MLESLFNKVAGLQVRNFIKKRLQHSWFTVNIAKILRAPILKNICEQLLLYFSVMKFQDLDLFTYFTLTFKAHHSPLVSRIQVS